MPLVDIEGVRPVLMGDLSATVEKGEGGVIYVRPDVPLGPYPRSMIDRLVHWARETPDHVFLADRVDGGDWRKLTYAQVWQKTRARNISSTRSFPPSGRWSSCPATPSSMR